MSKIKVLFICVHNSARSQMAEAFLNGLGGDRFLAESAGLEPGQLNQLVVESMKEIGIDISKNTTKSVLDIFKSGRVFDYVITVCDGANAEKCPVFSAPGKQIHWVFPDPSALVGSREERLEKVRTIRDEIKERIKNWVSEAVCEGDAA
ncbi:arsenate reductase ArsC [Candidatus Omnitrophota bacterium]